MPRFARCRRAPGFLEPGRIYHVTNRGVDRCAIFHSDLDRIIFLSLLAEACLTSGATCHAWCLMDTHFHVVLEDPRGLLSQLMHRVESGYARYFNDTRPGRRSGPLFDSRFRAELIDSEDYFEEACAYVLLNPVRTRVPMAPSAEAYAWSSAAVACSGLTEAELAEGLLGRVGGVEGVLTTLPPTRHAESRERRRARLETLASGAWMTCEQALGCRTPEQYRQLLAVRAAQAAASPEREPSRRAGGALAAAAARRFAGLALAVAREAIEDACAGVLPVALPDATQVLVYALWRFTSASLEELAEAVGATGEAVAEAIRLQRRDRQRERAWQRLLWRLEWGLRWRLKAAPHRA